MLFCGNTVLPFGQRQLRHNRTDLLLLPTCKFLQQNQLRQMGCD